MEYTVEAPFTYDEVADLLYKMSYRFMGTKETKVIAYTVLSEILPKQMTCSLVIQYGLRDDEQEQFFTEWEETIYEVSKTMNTIITEADEKIIMADMERIVTDYLDKINTRYYDNIALISDEERELLLDNHVVTSNTVMDKVVDLFTTTLENNKDHAPSHFLLTSKTEEWF